MERIYLDHAATTPMHPEVIETVTAQMNDTFGNPSSIHSFGRSSRQAVDRARTAAAASIGADFNEIIFTSGGTEADNLAIVGTAQAMKHRGRHIITSAVEHHAVLHTCAYLEKEGYEVTYLPVNKEGLVRVADLAAALREDTILVTIMYGNNEVGTIQPIAEIGELLQEHPAVFHTDAVQAYGAVAIDVKADHIDLLSVSSHKINGPKGVGFLYAREGLLLTPGLFGGEQERKRRAGTENVPAIAGFGKAIELAMASMAEKSKRYSSFKERLMHLLTEKQVAFSVNGSLERSLPHVLNLSFPGTDVESVLVNLDLAGVAASSGSACTAGSIEPSHVLVAMFGKESDRLRNSIRFSFGITNTEEQIDQAGEATANIIARLTNK
ncbi:cysteine desulfurase family protein [Bacillus badius]|uniref:cysteine desulfurase n=1 Tax=Bacillus badius TaxID=1455 RepID=A0ABR5ATD0_BACBA|nr:cysteine desulfurase family protein [Bacillus badius]KIL78022.1 Cysteine desulfurase [Bacillus badius]KZR58427.1 cysteine desulfurase NifS [Bacillus badius]MED4716449.1 cysteine desulfurase family protein [Bacillus badius]